jgi:hypothetical protein
MKWFCHISLKDIWAVVDFIEDFHPIEVFSYFFWKYIKC